MWELLARKCDRIDIVVHLFCASVPCEMVQFVHKVAKFVKNRQKKSELLILKNKPKESLQREEIR